jgi:molybdenum cofactor biosynthesis protein B
VSAGHEEESPGGVPGQAGTQAGGSAEEHRQRARGQRARCAVLTVSDSRSPATDQGGPLIVGRLEKNGHTVVARGLVPDDAERIERALRGFLEDHSPDLVITTGGTGISSRDTTIEVVERLLDKELDGFGELFRMLSWSQVGSAAMLSRAVAGLAGETVVFALPGSPNAVQIALDRLILPELPHLLWERKR